MANKHARLMIYRDLSRLTHNNQRNCVYTQRESRVESVHLAKIIRGKYPEKFCFHAGIQCVQLYIYIYIYVYVLAFESLRAICPLSIGAFRSHFYLRKRERERERERALSFARERILSHSYALECTRNRTHQLRSYSQHWLRAPEFFVIRAST